VKKEQRKALVKSRRDFNRAGRKSNAEWQKEVSRAVAVREPEIIYTRPIVNVRPRRGLNTFVEALRTIFSFGRI
jgi:hypothetical protein